MNVKELIKELQQLPEDFEVVCGNSTIYDVGVAPAHYDGPYVKLKNNRREFEYVNEGYKVQLECISALDIIYDRGRSVYIEYSKAGPKSIQDAYKTSDEKEKELVENSHILLETRLFVEWVKSRVSKITGHGLDENIITKWAKINLIPSFGFDLVANKLSYKEARFLYWDKAVSLTYENNGIVSINWKK
jgi:hypothetical protein